MKITDVWANEYIFVGQNNSSTISDKMILWRAIEPHTVIQHFTLEPISKNKPHRVAYELGCRIKPYSQTPCFFYTNPHISLMYIL